MAHANDNQFIIFNNMEYALINLIINFRVHEYRRHARIRTVSNVFISILTCGLHYIIRKND